MPRQRGTPIPNPPPPEPLLTTAEAVKINPNDNVTITSYGMANPCLFVINGDSLVPVHLPMGVWSLRQVISAAEKSVQ